MKLHLLIHCAAIISIALCGCVSLERDIYFRTKNPDLSSELDNRTPYPQQLFGQSIKINGQIDRKITWMILNQASGSYLWGIVIPVIPVFFYPGFHFKLNQREKLNLQCSIDYQVEVKKEGNGYYTQTEESIELHKKGKKLGNDLCIDAMVLIENQLPMKPLKIERDSTFTVFTYDIAAADVSAFTIDQIGIKMRTGEKIKIENQFEVTKRDWTRLYFPPINN